MPRDKEGHGIILDDKGQEQPTDKDRAQTAQKTEPGHMPSQPEKHEKPRSEDLISCIGRIRVRRQSNLRP
jgi:hypothetical protein